MKRLILSVFALVALLGSARSQLLFESDELLHLKIKFNVKETISDRKDREEHDGTIYYGDSDTLTVKLKVRGITRANPSVCSFPPLRLNLKKKQVKGTIFEGQDKLKLVTHCGNRSINEQYLLREYMVYKMYELITPYSFRVRLCKISYLDTNGKYDPKEQFAFIIEDIDEVAARNNMKEYKGKIMNQDVCMKEEVDKLILFQYMIGNLDWSVPNGHNFKLIYGEDYPLPIAVPYDFDFSGMVNTGYSSPPKEININSVRERNFRGFCREPGIYEAVAEGFVELKPQFYSLYTNSEYLSEKSIEMSVKYLDSFYETLANEKEFEREIVNACRIDHQHIYEK